MTNKEQYLFDQMITRSFITGVVTGAILGAIFIMALVALFML